MEVVVVSIEEGTHKRVRLVKTAITHFKIPFGKAFIILLSSR